MAARQMRDLAEQTPEIARELGSIADELHFEANALASHIDE